MDSLGNVWVVDNGNNRVQKFRDSNGTPIAPYAIPSSCANTSCTASAATGQFNGPIYVTVDKANNVWVSDYHRIQEFTSAGLYISSLTCNYAPCVLFTPRPMTFDSHGDLWTVDNYSDVVDEFSRAARSCKSSAEGTAPALASTQAAGQAS